VVTRVLSTRTPPAANPFLQGASKKEQLVITASIGMQFRQEHSPHMPILEKCGPISVPCLSHEIKPPCHLFSSFYAWLRHLVKRIIEQAQPLEGQAQSHLHMWLLRVRRVAIQLMLRRPTRRSARRMNRGIGEHKLLYFTFGLSATQEIDGFSATTTSDGRLRTMLDGEALEVKARARWWGVRGRVLPPHVNQQAEEN
jgi:hypothetical protein